MNIYSKQSLFNSLKSSCIKDWDKYTNHCFLKSLADGTLPLKSFKKYLIQDYFFLLKFIKILSLASLKSDNYQDMMRCVEFIIAIKNELKTHILYCKKWKISNNYLMKNVELRENKNYSDYVLNVGSKGDLLDLFTALSPCIIGYGEIGFNLSSRKKLKNPYISWIKTYSSREYQQVARENILFLDSLLKKNIRRKKKVQKLKKYLRKPLN